MRNLTLSLIIDRSAFDETISAMFTNPLYNEYLFYASTLSQVEIEFKEMQFPAAVYFCKRRLNFVVIISCSFGNYPIQQRLAILKHEVLHILWGHLKGIHLRNLNKWQQATDCSVNQFIEKSHLPEGVILPETLGLPEKLSSEDYYNLIKEDSEPQSNHELWEDVGISDEVMSDVTSKIIEKSTDFTIRNKGKLPENISEMIELNLPPKLNWKVILKRFMTIKRGKRPTSKRQNRRFPDNPSIRGYVKELKSDITVILDVSMSISDNDIQRALAEVKKIADLQGSEVTLIQIDTEPKEPEILTRKTEVIERRGAGGTFLSPALNLIKNKKTALLIITDGGLFQEDIEIIENSGFNVLWMITESSYVNPFIKKYLTF